MTEDRLPQLRNVAAFFLIMFLAVGVGLAIGVAIFGAPGLPPENPEGRIAYRPPDEVVQVSLREFAIDADPVTVFRGDSVRFVVTNNGTIQHDFKIEGTEGVSRVDPGKASSFQTDPVQEDLIAWCTVLGHRENGMEITIRVVDKPEPRPGDAPREGGSQENL